MFPRSSLFLPLVLLVRWSFSFLPSSSIFSLYEFAYIGHTLTNIFCLRECLHPSVYYLFTSSSSFSLSSPPVLLLRHLVPSVVCVHYNLCSLHDLHLAQHVRNISTNIIMTSANASPLQSSHLITITSTPTPHRLCAGIQSAPWRPWLLPATQRHVSVLIHSKLRSNTSISSTTAKLH